MAKKDSQDFNPQDSSSIEPRRFDGNLEKNFNDYHLKENQWTYARNAITNSNIGDLGRLGNEPSNRECIQVPSGYSIIGAIHLERDLYVIFSTDNSNSEIGYFQKDTCTYTKIVNDTCLNFKTTNLIYGVSRESSDCNHTVYWSDGLNPDRFLNIGDIRVAPYAQPWPNIPWKCEDATPNDDCFICDPVGPPYILDCDKIRLAPLMQPLCFRVEKTASGGNLLNGSYMVVGAYTIGGEKMTDYFPPSNQQPIFDHSGVGGSITIVIENADTTYFDEFELVVISVIGQQTVAKKVGIYSTRQGIITLDIIDPSLPSVPIEQIPVRTPVYDKSDAMYVVNDYLLRVGPTTKLDFNYQPLANQIVTKWQSVEYDANYYKNGGNKTGYMRDEVYSFFIRWVYDTGDRSASYHIPGRPAFIVPKDVYPLGIILETNVSPPTDDAYENYVVDENGQKIYVCPPKVWEVYNTATVGDQLNIPVDFEEEGCINPGRGKVIREGLMGYWESTERYPDNKPEIWNSNISIPPPAYSDTDPDSYNLCGKPIRHHKFPDNDRHPDVTIFDTTAAAASPAKSQKIRILGVYFENIKAPLIDPQDPTKGYVPGIKCFEILRGSRQGNRSVIAKGIINNMGRYLSPGIPQTDNTGDDFRQEFLFENYPYNDVRGDEFLSEFRTRWKGTGNLIDTSCDIGYINNDGSWKSGRPGVYEFNQNNYTKNYFSFHSPETTFAKPFLGARELKIYQDLDGLASMQYQFPNGHPQHKLVKDITWLLAAIAGLGTAATAALGKITRRYDAPKDPITNTQIGNSPPGAISEISTINLLLGVIGFGWDTLGYVQNIIPAAGTLFGTLGLNFDDSADTYIEEGGLTKVSPALSILMSLFGGLPTFAYYWTEGAEATYRLIKNSVPYQQYALQQFSHCFYNNVVSGSSTQAGAGPNSRPTGQRRRYLKDVSYVDDQIQNFDIDRKINNLYRNNYVALALERSINLPFYIGQVGVVGTWITDESRKDTSLKGLAAPYDQGTEILKKVEVYSNPQRTFERQSTTYYTAIKQRLSNQYGQLDNITQLPITTCPYCCLDGDPVEELIVNGVFNGSTGWSTNPSGSWLSTQCSTSSSPGFGTTGTPQPNLLYQSAPISFIPGERYTLCFDICNIQNPEFQLGFGFNSSQITAASNSMPNTVLMSPGQTSGSYCHSFLALPGYDNVLFKEINKSACLDVPAIIPFNDLGIPDNNNPRALSTSCYSNGIDIHLGIQGNYSYGNISAIAGPGNVSTKKNDPDPCSITGRLKYSDITNAYFEASVAGDYCFRATVEFTTPLICPIFNVVDYDIIFYIAVFKPGSETAYTLPLCTWASSSGCPSGRHDFPITAPGTDYYCIHRESSSIPILLPQIITKTFSISNGNPIHLEPGWKAIGYVVMSRTNCTVKMKLEPVFNEPTIIDNVSLKRTSCPPEPFAYGPLFGGDIYINRYTEKNTFFYFYNWLFNQPDGAAFNYQKYNMLPFPTYWVNTEEFDVMEGVAGLTNILNPTTWISAVTTDISALVTYLVEEIAGNNPPQINSSIGNLFQDLKTPSDYHVLDRPDFGWQIATAAGIVSGTGLGGAILSACGPGLIIKYGYFYLFNSGVRDFYVESEFNTALRDWDDDPARRHYDHKSYTSLPDMFKTDIIKSGNFYRYDTSLSISKNWFSYVKWGNLQQRSYDPTLAETCYQYRPDRVIYSLQSQYEALRDNWRIFLPNNYKDFLSRVKSIKQINKSGSLILFESDSPVMFQGLDTLETELSTKLTIGDGGLFSQPMQSVMNAERSFEYASCQNRLSVLNTPMGVFWINMDQGKIFQFQSGLKEISMGNVKWWLNQYLPYQLTKYFPNYIHNDNPVYGIGCQTIYDNTNNLIYFTKKDYKPKLDGRNIPLVSYDVNTDTFIGTQGDLSFVVTLGDPRFFEDASWTMSYDLKTETWVSFHDWHPDLTIASKNTFMSTKGNKVWVHNDSCSSYTNYYGVNYPFEVEYTVNTIQTVNTLRSIEYQLEVYKYNQENCYDRFHVLDFNFDSAVVYNTEQCSGTLKLNLSPKNNAPAILAYPFYDAATVANEILYSKEENRYRFNQFWDITRDRGEFPLGSDYPPIGAVNPGTTVLAGTYPERTIWNTGPDGYKRNLNNANLNYGKSPLQRKKFRHYTTSVLLRRKVSGDRKMLVSITNNKNLYSPR